MLACKASTAALGPTRPCTLLGQVVLATPGRWDSTSAQVNKNRFVHVPEPDTVEELGTTITSSSTGRINHADMCLKLSCRFFLLHPTSPFGRVALAPLALLDLLLVHHPLLPTGLAAPLVFVIIHTFFHALDLQIPLGGHCVRGP